MNSGSSAFIGSGGQSSDTSSSASCSHTSRPGVIGTSPPVRRMTRTWRTPGQCSSALSTFLLSGMRLPPRHPSSAQITTEESQSWIRFARLSGEKPPNTIEWIAPIRVHASIAAAASAIIGRYSVTRSPLRTPSPFRTLAKRQVSRCSSR